MLAFYYVLIIHYFGSVQSLSTPTLIPTQSTEFPSFAPVLVNIPVQEPSLTFEPSNTLEPTNEPTLRPTSETPLTTYPSTSSSVTPTGGPFLQGMYP